MNEVELAIHDVQAMRQTHVDWIDHFAPDGKHEIKCYHCPENIRELVGDLDHHRQAVAQYDRVLRVLDTEGEERS